MFIWIVWAGMVLILIAINNTPNFLTRTWNPKVAVCEVGDIYLTQSEAGFLVLRIGGQPKRESGALQGVMACVQPACSQKQVTDTNSNTTWMILPNWQFCLLWRRHAQNLGHIYLTTLSRRLHSVKRKVRKNNKKTKTNVSEKVGKNDS